MKAVTWHGKRDVRVESVPDPTIQEPTDAIIRVTSAASAAPTCTCTRCSAPFMTEGDILGHEPMGIVEEVGAEVTDLRPGDRVVVPFNISCGHCCMCAHGAATRSARPPRSASTARARRCSATPSCTARCRAARPSTCACPQAQFGPIKVPDGPPDERFVYLSDVLPTAWQAVEYAAIPAGGTVAVLGLGPIGQMAPASRRTAAPAVIGVDLRAGAAGDGPPPRRRGRSTCASVDDVAEAVRDLTGGRGADAVIDAVGMEAHGSPVRQARADGGRLAARRASPQPLMTKVGVDRLAALHAAIDVRPARRHGVDHRRLRRDDRPDADDGDVRQAGSRCGWVRRNVKRWIDDILPLLTDDADPLA